MSDNEGNKDIAKPIGGEMGRSVSRESDKWPPPTVKCKTVTKQSLLDRITKEKDAQKE